MDDTLPARTALRRPALAAVMLGAVWLCGCSNFYGTTAASFLKHAKDPDPNVRYIAYNKLASPNCYDNEQQKAHVVDVLISRLEQGKEPVASRAVICRTLGELGNPKAREILLKLVSDDQPLIRVQACRALGKVGRPEDATILSRVMTVDTLEDCRIAAIEGIGALRSHDPRIIEVLIGGMDHEDPAIRYSSLQSLRQITGKDLGVKPEPWQKYLQEQVAQAERRQAAEARSAATATATAAATSTANRSADSAAQRTAASPGLGRALAPGPGPATIPPAAR
jgi:HEAT repeat protein